MKCESFKQFAIVKEETAAAFTESLNAEMERLKDKRPIPSFSEADPYLCRISYTESVLIPESLADEYELKGVNLTCGDCPFFEPAFKADGTEDGRCKTGRCPISHYGIRYKKSGMCDAALEMLNDGRLRLCFGNLE